MPASDTRMLRKWRPANAEKLMALMADLQPLVYAAQHLDKSAARRVELIAPLIWPGRDNSPPAMRRGITLFILILIADTLLMFAMMVVLARFWMFAISFMLLVGLWLYILFDAIRRARRTPPLPDHGHSGWATYVAAFTVACLLIAWPFLYGWHAHASGRLCGSANSPSMSPPSRRRIFSLMRAITAVAHRCG